MPKDLRDRLEAARNENGRSLNAEILLRLERSLEGLTIERLDPQSAEFLTKKLEELHQEFEVMREAYAEASEFIRELREVGAKRG
jgi:Rad3-related DNA helicase